MPENRERESRSRTMEQGLAAATSSAQPGFGARAAGALSAGGATVSWAAPGPNWGYLGRGSPMPFPPQEENPAPGHAAA